MKQVLWGTQRHLRSHLQQSSPNSSLSTCLGGNITSPSEWSLRAIEADAPASARVAASGVAWQLGMPFEVSQHKGDPCRIKAGPAVVDALLEASRSSSKLTDLCLHNVMLFFAHAVSHDFGMGFPGVQVIGSFGQGIEPHAGAS